MINYRLNRCATFLSALLLASTGTGQAQDIQTERVSFPRGETGTVIEGRITGDQIFDYVLGATAGQVMLVDMQTSNPGGYFNLLPRGSNEAIHIGSSSGNVATVVLPGSGDYVLRVYLARAAARRNETATYSLSVSIGAPDFADGLAGGPDYWQVAEVDSGDSLAVHSGPRPIYEVVGRVQNGEALQNNGCRMSQDQRWCEIRATGSGLRGWVEGRFLIEGAAPARAETPAGGPVGNGFPFDATGSVPCATVAGQPSRPCLFGVVREGPGNAGIWIALGDGVERQILFEGGVPVATNIGAPLSFTKEADLFVVRVGEERYEIPESVVNGG